MPMNSRLKSSNWRRYKTKPSEQKDQEKVLGEEEKAAEEQRDQEDVLGGKEEAAEEESDG